MTTKKLLINKWDPAVGPVIGPFRPTAMAIVKSMMPSTDGGIAGVGLDSSAYKDILREAQSEFSIPPDAMAGVDQEVRALLEEIGRTAFGMFD